MMMSQSISKTALFLSNLPPASFDPLRSCMDAKYTKGLPDAARLLRARSFSASMLASSATKRSLSLIFDFVRKTRSSPSKISLKSSDQPSTTAGRWVTTITFWYFISLTREYAVTVLPKRILQSQSILSLDLKTFCVFAIQARCSSRKVIVRLKEATGITGIPSARGF